MVTIQYTSVESEFIFQWVDRWFKVADIILELMCFDRTPSLPPPTEMDEINYQTLRFWFIENEDQFLKIWKDFYNSLEQALHLDRDESGTTTNAYNYLLNPFDLYYKPENLFHLVKALDIQSGIEMWDPSKHRAWAAVIDMLNMGKVVVKFLDWVDEHTYEAE